jgi:hypothetical protein
MIADIFSEDRSGGPGRPSRGSTAIRSLALAPLLLFWACGSKPAEEPRYRVEAGSGVAVVFREPDPDPRVGNAASAGGVFRLSGACLVVEVGGSARTPVFPAPARFDPKARRVAVGGKLYALDRPYRLEFASAGKGLSELLPNHSAFPSSCPTETFNFGGIAEPAEADRPVG